MNFTVDTTIGVVLNWALLQILSYVAQKKQWTSLQNSGEYGTPPRISIWLLQLLSWLLILLFTKIVLTFSIYAYETPLGSFAEWLFQPLVNHPEMELMIVMIACPCLMNALQFWIQDNFLKKNNGESDSMLAKGSEMEERTILDESSDSEEDQVGIEMPKMTAKSKFGRQTSCMSQADVL